jgi:hypothetical protein
MPAASSPDTWREKCYVSITPQVATGATSTAVAIEGIVETVDIDVGEKGLDIVALVNGGRVVKFNPMEESTLKFEGYPVVVENLTQQFTGTLDAVQPIISALTHTRTPLRVSIMWTDDDTVTGIVDSKTATSIDVAGTPYTSSEMIGRVLRMTSGAALNKEYIVASNDNNTINIVSGNLTTDGVLAADTFSLIPAGEGATRANKRALRIVAADCRITSCKPAFTDYNLKYTFELKFGPFDKSANANLNIESTDGTSPLTTLASYTETVKW